VILNFVDSVRIRIHSVGNNMRFVLTKIPLLLYCVVMYFL